MFHIMHFKCIQICFSVTFYVQSYSSQTSVSKHQPLIVTTCPISCDDLLRYWFNVCPINRVFYPDNNVYVLYLRFMMRVCTIHFHEYKAFKWNEKCDN